MFQSNDEVLRIFSEWGDHYAPKNFIQNEKNAMLLADYVLKTWGIFSVTYLTKGMKALAAEGKLDLVPEPKKLTAVEREAIFRKRELLRILAEKKLNEIPFEERVKAEKAKREADAWIKGQEEARAQLGAAILDYKCYGLNRTDITGSEMVQRDLKTIRIPAHDGKGIDGKNTDYIATLEWVRAIILALPDHPKMGDVQSAVQRVKQKFVDHANKPKDKNQGW